MTTESATAQALELAAAVGPYFVLAVGTDTAPWRPFIDLLTAEVLHENVDAVVRVLAEQTRTPAKELDRRACASTHFLGLASRLTAPTLGATALAGHVPLLEPSGLAWQRVDRGPVPLAVTTAGGVQAGDAAGAADALHAGVVQTVVAPLEAAFEAAFDLSPQVLWGNVASAVAGAMTMLRHAGQAPRIDPRTLAEAVTSRGALTGMGQWTSTGFVRNNCCLFYKVPGGGKCGDCVLT